MGATILKNEIPYAGSNSIMTSSPLFTYNEVTGVLTAPIMSIPRFTGQMYVNDTGKMVQSLKIHNHLTTSEIGGGEFKGEFINTIGTVDGVASHWSYEPTGNTGAPSAVRSGIFNMTLSAGKTMTAGMIAGSQNSTIIMGTLNGADILEFGTLGVLDGTGTRTLVKESSAIAGLLHVLSGDEPATGHLSMCYLSNDYSGTADSAIRIGAGTITSLIDVSAATNLTNFVNFDAVAGCLSTQATALSGVTTSHKLLVGVTAGGLSLYIPLITSWS